MPGSLRRLIGQHPAALRAVCWTDGADAAAHELLEIETKHGQVVVIDPATGEAYANPPRPPDTGSAARRLQRDLTEAVPEAFDDRPVFVGLAPASAPVDGFSGWRFELSTGIVLTLTRDHVVPVPSRIAAGA